MASLPLGYEGEFGPHLKSLILGLKHICLMSEPKILEFMTDHGVRISSSTISRILLNQEWAHEEKKAIVRAGFSSSIHQHIDDTKARVHGKNHHTHVLRDEFYTAYFTTEHKDRLSVLDILRGFKPRSFLLNEEFVELMGTLGLSEKWVASMKLHLQATPLDETQMKNLLVSLFDQVEMGKTVQKRIMEAAAIAAYHQEDDCIALLLCDEAPQFKLLALDLALCWIHEGRHYKKLLPVIAFHQEILKDFLEDFWNYYHQSRQFKELPTQEAAQQLRARFDELFMIETGYEQLDQRIAKTRTHAQALLQVLQNPQLPLHNNPAELGARTAVRRRDVSLHNMTTEGTKANDSFMTLTETAKKLEVSRFGYFYDRISGTMKMTSLAQVIEEKTMGHSLGTPIRNDSLVQLPIDSDHGKSISQGQALSRNPFLERTKNLLSLASIAIKQKLETFLPPSVIPNFNTS
ncbi:transposase [Deltaproteobacteria bacterium TL4]